MARAQARYEITAEDKTRRAFQSVRKNIKGATKALGGFSRALGSVAGVGGLGGFAGAIKGALDLGDRVQKMSIRLGTSTEFLSEMAHVAELTGVEFRTLGIGIQRMTRRIGDNTKGTAEALSAMGLSIRDLQMLDAEQQFLAVAEALEGVENQSLKVSLAAKIFDSEGVALLQTMEGGAAAIEKMREEARALGLTLTRDAADKMAEANDALTRLNASFKAVGTNLAVEFSDPIIEAAGVLSKVLVPVLGGVGGILKSIGRTIGGVAAALVSLLAGDFKQATTIAKLTFDDLVSDISKGAQIAIAEVQNLVDYTTGAAKTLSNVGKPESRPGTSEEFIRGNRSDIEYLTRNIDKLSKQQLDAIILKFDQLRKKDEKKEQQEPSPTKDQAAETNRLLQEVVNRIQVGGAAVAG